MLKLWNDDEKDFTLIVGDRELQVNKLILRVNSPVFAAMFKSGMKEAIENKVETIGFDNFEVVESAIKYCYGFDIRQNLSVKRAMPLLQFADFYDIRGFKECPIDVTWKISKDKMRALALVANLPRHEGVMLKLWKTVE
uniref:BTB domain-containing protein n=1 Tax=Panagrolaimus sp. PS1159 TaxID=55785 RepID=A0AC35F5N7_9BILA